MILSNEFTVGADVETVWRQLLDMEGVASCLPGATIEATDEEGTYNGSMRVRVGPMTVSYTGSAVLQEVDEESRTATISLRAREEKGQGTAMATIRNRLEDTGEGTRVLAETDLHVTGPQAQFGRGVMEDVSSRVLSEFARRLEERISGGSAEGAEPSGAGARAASDGAGAEDDSLDLGSLLSSTLSQRYSRLLVGALVAIAALVVLRAVRNR